MRLPRVRFTVRRMMVAVAVVALALAGGAWWRRTTVVRESRMILWIEGVPDVVVREYADGRVEHEPQAG